MKKVFALWMFAFSSLAGTAAFAQTGADFVRRGLAAQEAEKYAEAFGLFQTAAAEGNAEGQYQVGYCYLTGQGVEHSDGEAVTWFLKAANQGNAKSEVALGNCYENGWGEPTDPAKAESCYQKAVQEGFTGAEAELKRLESIPTATPSAPEPTPSLPSP